jgi:hypothetical protein
MYSNFNALFRREEEYEMDLRVVKYASRRSSMGDFRAIHRSEAPGSGAFWPLTRVQGKWGCRLRGDPGTADGECEPSEPLDCLDHSTVSRGLGTHVGLDIGRSGV